VSTFMRMRRLVERAIRLAAWAAVAAVVPLMLVTTADVAGRDFLGKPLAGTYELSEYMLAVAVLLGAAWTQQVKGHVAATFVAARLNRRARAACRVLTLALCLIVVAALAWQGFAIGLEETGVTDQLRIPRAPFKTLVGVGAALLWFQLLFDFVDAVAELGRRQG